MLRWSLIFLLVALVAGFLGFWGLEGMAMWFAKVLFFVFLVLFLISLVTGPRTSCRSDVWLADSGSTLYEVSKTLSLRTDLVAYGIDSPHRRPGRCFIDVAQAVRA